MGRASGLLGPGAGRWVSYFPVRDTHCRKAALQAGMPPKVGHGYGDAIPTSWSAKGTPSKEGHDRLEQVPGHRPHGTCSSPQPCGEASGPWEWRARRDGCGWLWWHGTPGHRVVWMFWSPLSPCAS